MCFYCICWTFGSTWSKIYRTKIKLIENTLNNNYIIRSTQVESTSLRKITERVLIRYIDIYAEWNPLGNKARIPQMCKKNFYNQYLVPYLKTISDKIPSYNYFIKIWNRTLKHVYMTNKQRFGQCSNCHIFNVQILQDIETDRKIRKTKKRRLVEIQSLCENNNNNNNQRSNCLQYHTMLLKSVHLEDVRNSRRIVLYWQLYAVHNLKKVLFLSVDRMDQMKTMLPSTYRMVKHRENMTRLETSVMAYISSVKPYGMFYWNIQNISKDTNVHCWMDLLVFEKIKKSQGFLPPRLILSMDNTSAENKNYIYLKFSILLVSLGVFKEIQWIFLHVGHTHGYTYTPKTLIRI